MGSRRRSSKDGSAIFSRGLDAGNNGSQLAGKIARQTRGNRSRRPSSRRRRLIFESLGQRRVLAVITGTVFNDADASMRSEPGEVRLESRLAYIDSNDNAALDANERFALTDTEGQFRFDDLAAGIYSVRLYDGADSQQQSFPAAASQKLLPVSFENSIAAALSGDTLQILTSGKLHQVELSGTRASTIQLDFNPTELVTAISIGDTGAASASLVAGAFDDDGQQRSGLWLVPSSGGTAGLVYSGSGSLSTAVGPDGYGLVVASGDDESTVFSIQISQATESSSEYISDPLDVLVVPTEITVPAGTQVLSSSAAVDFSASSPSAFGSRTVVAWPVDTTTGPVGTDAQSIPALKTSLWSNTTASWIGGTETVIVGATELVSFDDSAGLLAVRYAQGGIGILDVDSGFAQLHAFASIDGPVAFVPGSDALASISSGESGVVLSIQDIRDGKLLARQTIDIASIGQPISIVASGSLDSFFLLGDTGALAVQFDQPAAHRVVLAETHGVVNLEFGVQVQGENQSPVVTGSVNVNGLEDTELAIGATKIAALVDDAERDRLISLVVQSPEHGSVSLAADGGVNYQPDVDYNGTDSFSIRFHDGQNVSAPVAFSVSIAAQPDVPTGIRFRGDAIPEHTEDRYLVGSLDVLDVDIGDEYELAVFDSRFTIEDGSLIFLGGGLDYEFEPEILIAISGFDPAAKGYFGRDIVVHVEDENDPVSDVVPNRGNVTENELGAFIVTLDAFDQDIGQTITFSVNDDRFTTIGTALWLAEGQSINYEAEPVVVLTITADDNAGSTASTELRVSVRDLPEPIGQLTLSNQTVVEFEAGATVGDVHVDGFAAADSYRLTVDDPRFEIDGSELKLLDDQFVRRSEAEQIELMITAQDTSGVFVAVTETFVIEVLRNESPFHNDENPYDVDGNGTVSPLDALAIINYLNLYGPGPVGPGDTGYGYDVNHDSNVTTLDALLVINYLNRLRNPATVGGEGTAGGEGEEGNPTKELSNSTDDSSATAPLVGPPASERTPELDDRPEIGPVDTSDRSKLSLKTSSQLAPEGEFVSPGDLLGDIYREDQDPEITQAIDDLLSLLDDPN